MRRRLALVLLITTAAIFLGAVLLVSSQPSPPGGPAGPIDPRTQCPILVNDALQQVGESCAELGRNTACYGYIDVDAEFSVPVDPAFFSTIGDTSDLLEVNRIRTSPLDLILNEWGVSVLNVQANVPNTLPGQAVKFLLFGDTEVEDNADPDNSIPEGPVLEVMATGAVTLRGAPRDAGDVVGSYAAGVLMQADALNPDGDWVRVAIPADEIAGWVPVSQVMARGDLTTLATIERGQFNRMQAFYFSTGIGPTTCTEAPNTLMVQGPQRVTVDIQPNGANVRISSAIVLRILPPGDIMQLIVLSDTAILYPDEDREREVAAGETSFICLSQPENLGNATDSLINDRLAGISEEGSLCEWTAPRPLTQAEFVELSFLYDGDLEPALNYPLTPLDGLTPVDIVEQIEEPGGPIFVLPPGRTANDVGISKVVDNPVPFPGNVVRFTLTAGNNGLNPATGIAVADVLPAGLTLQSAAATQGGYDGVTWVIGDLQPGQTATLTLDVVVDGGTGGQTLLNTANISATSPDQVPVNDTSTAAVTVQIPDDDGGGDDGGGDDGGDVGEEPTPQPTPEPTTTPTVSITPEPTVDIGITKTASVDGAFVGDSFDFTVNVINNGPGDATGLVIFDPLPPSYTATGVSTSTGAYDPATGLWTIGDLLANTQANLVITVTVNSLPPGGLPLSNLASLSAVDQVDSNSTNNDGSVELIACTNIPNPIPPGDTTAFVQAVNSAQSSVCFPGTPTINLSAGTYDFTSAVSATQGANALPDITRALVINGNGATINRSSSSTFRFFYVGASGDLTLNGMTLQNGAADDGSALLGENGGAVLVDGGNLTTSGVNFLNNSAEFGGAVYQASDFVADQTTFQGNSADALGGAIYTNGTLTLRNSLISGNLAFDYSAIYQNSGTADLLNVTIAGNRSTDGAAQGAVSLIGGSVANTIVFGNAGGSSEFSTSGTVSYSNIQGGVQAGTGNISADPLFIAPEPAANAPTVNGNYRLGDNSPSTDAGDNSAAGGLSVDLVGNPRFFDDGGVIDTGDGTAPIVDMGAYERQTDSGSPCSAFSSPYTVAAGDETDLVFAVECANLVGGASTLLLPAGSFYDYVTGHSSDPVNALPRITSDVTIQSDTPGTKATISFDGENSLVNLRLFRVNSGATLNLTDIILDEGADDDGLGGAIIYNEGTLNITRGLLQSGFSPSASGGAITQSGSTASLNILDTHFAGNEAPNGVGGALNLLGGTATINRSLFDDNVASAGGAIYTELSSLDITNSTFFDNRSTGGAGAIEGNNANGSIRFATFFDNTGTFGGDTDTFFNILGSIIAANDANEPLCVGGFSGLISGDYNIATDTSCGLGGANDDETATPAQVNLQALADNGGLTQTLALGQPSIARDYVPAASCTAVTEDQRGAAVGPRPFDGDGIPGADCDAGAFEAQSASALADLELNKFSLAFTVQPGAQISFRTDVENLGPDPATNVVVQETFPANYTLLNTAISATNPSSYDPVSNQWTIDQINVGETVQLTLTFQDDGSVPDTQPNTVAEVIAVDQADPDSTPGNDVLSEDDQDNMAVLVCPVSFPITLPNTLGTALDEYVDCANTNGNSPTVDEIIFPANAVFDFNLTFFPNATNATAITAIDSEIRFTGNGATLQRNAASGSQYRALSVIGGQLDITDLTITGMDSESSGGAIAVDGGSLTLTNVTLSNNRTDADGGAISSVTGTSVTISDSTLSGNAAVGLGGGVQAFGALTMQRSLLSSNRAEVDGGAINFGEGGSSIRNVTMTANSAGRFGGAIAYPGLSDVHALDFVTFFNNNTDGASSTVFFSNNAVDISNSLLVGSGSLCSITGLIEANSLGGNIATQAGATNPCDLDDPSDTPNALASQVNLQALADNGGLTQTLALGQPSIARDYVPAASCTAVTEDQRGLLRPAEGDGIAPADCDAGAFEAQSVSVANLALAQALSTSADFNANQITNVITLTNNGPDSTTATVSVPIPAGLSYVADNIAGASDGLASNELVDLDVPNAGTYDPGTGIWQVDELANGATTTLTLTLAVVGTAGDILPFDIQITAASAADPDTSDNTATEQFYVCGDTNIPAGDVTRLIAEMECANLNPDATTLNLAAGSVYTLTEVNNTLVADNENGTPEITTPLTINGNGATITRDVAAPPFRILRAVGTGAAYTLNDLTIENGDIGLGSGGGLSTFDGADTTLNNVTFRNHVGLAGGALHIRGGTHTWTQVFVEDSNSRSSVNLGEAAIVDVDRSSFTGNPGGVIGGGIYMLSGTQFSLTNSVVANNQNGGISVNQAGTQASIINSTIANNTDFGVRSELGASTIIENSIVYGNTGALFTDGSSTLTAAYSNIEGGFAGAGNIDLDPLFVAPVALGTFNSLGDYNLQILSPVVDRASNLLLPGGITLDFAGNPRRFDDPGAPDQGQGSAPIVDMGAYESQQDRCATIGFPTATPQNYTVANTISNLLEALACAQANTTTADVLNLPTGTTYTFAEAFAGGDNAFANINSPITINGNNATFERSSDPATPDFRFFNLAVGADLTLNDLTLQNASAPSGQIGGAIQAFGTPITSTLNNVTFINSTAFRAAAAALTNGTHNWTNIVVQGASNNLGAIFLFGADFNLDRANITASSSHALYMQSGANVQITNSVLANNGGGGMWVNGNTGGLVTVINSTIANNGSRGIAAEGTSPTEVYNSIVYGNNGAALTGTLANFTAVEYSNIEGGFAGAGNIDLDPLFVAPQPNNLQNSLGNYNIPNNSPVIDAADNTRIPSGITLDILGNGRYFDNPGVIDTGIIGTQADVADMGAYENQDNACATFASPYPVTADDVADLIFAINCANVVPGADVLELPVDSTYSLDAVLLADALYGNTGLPAITTDISLVSVGAGLPPVIERSASATEPLRLFFVDTSGNLSMTNLRLQGGTTLGGGGAESSGAAIYNLGSLNINASVITNNTALDSGGALFNDNGVININGTSFLSNSAANADGGAIAQTGAASSLSIVNSSAFNGNTSALDGGALALEGGTANLTDVTMTGNLANTDGGGIYNDGTTITLANVGFDSNAADSDGDNAGDGGGIYNRTGSFDMTGGSFTSNTAFAGAGFVAKTDAVTLDMVTVSGNSAIGDGGGFLATDAVILTASNLTIEGNTAGALGAAGWLANGADVSISSSFVRGNAATAAGGAFYLDGSLGAEPDVTLRNSLISGNRASDGGAVYVVGATTPLLITNTTIAGNYTAGTDVNGAVYQEGGNVTLNNANIAGNLTANGVNNDYEFVSGTTTLNFSNVQDSNLSIAANNLSADPLFTAPIADPATQTPINTGDYTVQAFSPMIDAGDNGLASGLTVDLAGVNRFLDDPSVTDTGAGTAPLVDMGAYEFALDSCDDIGFPTGAPQTFALGESATAQDLANAITCGNQNTATADIIELPDGSVFTYETPGSSVANFGESALVIDGDITLVGLGVGATIERSSTATDDFRVILIDAANVTLQNLTIQNGRVTSSAEANGQNGAGVFLNGGTLAFSGVTLQGNEAGLDGGGFLNDGGTVTLNPSNILGNTAGTAGGGFRVVNGGSVTMTGGSIDGNIAFDGAGFDSEFAGTVVTLNNVALQNNVASNSGGGFYNSNGATVNVNGGSINTNSAPDGGGFYNINAGAVVNLDTVSVDGNSASNDGGGFLNDGGTVTLNGGSISGNNATLGGGFYTLGAAGTIDISNAMIENNTAGGDGAGLYMANGNVTISSSFLRGNDSGEDGGAISNVGNNLFLYNSLISGNRATARGGGIFTSHPTTLVNTTVAGNYAEGTSGGIHQIAGTTTLDNSIVAGNLDADLSNVDFFNVGGTATLNNSNVVSTDVSISPPNISADPLFTAPIADPATQTPINTGDYTLGDNSPSVDAGDNSLSEAVGLGAASLDLNGDPRYADDAGVVDTGLPSSTLEVIDQGAFEKQTDSVPIGPIIVTVLDEGQDEFDGECSLNEAIISANSDTAFATGGNECAAGSGADTIEFAPALIGSIVFNFAHNSTDGDNALPLITSDITINGDNRVTLDQTATMRFFYVDAGGALTLQNLTLEKAAPLPGGGAVRLNAGDFTAINTRFYNNATQDAGGAIFANNAANAMLINCEIAGNDAQLSGGGIGWFSTGTLTVDNCLLSGNYVDNGVGGGRGAAFLVSSGTANFNNTTIAGNYAPNFPGTGGGENQGGVVNFRNVILDENGTGGVEYSPTAGTTTAEYVLYGGSIPVFFGTGVQNSVDANFVAPLSASSAPIVGGDYRLGPGSSAIDAGDNSQTPASLTVDLDGNPRYYDDTGVVDTGFGTPPIVDLGAYERQSDTCPGFDTQNPTTYNVAAGSANDLIFAIECANVNTSTTDTLVLSSSGTYVLDAVYATTTFGDNGLPQISSPIIMQSDGSPVTIERDSTPGTPDFRIFEISTGDLTLIDLIIENGNTSGTGFSPDADGGNIINSGTLTLNNTTLQGGFADNDGGNLYMNAGTATLNDSLITGGTATTGGGNILHGTGTLTLDNTRVEAGSADAGGGIRSFDQLIIQNGSVIGGTLGSTGNSAISFGGGLDTFSGTTTIDNSTVSGNSAPAGGGIHFSNGALFIQNGSLIGGTLGSTGNEATGVSPATGSGITVDTFNASLTITDSAITGNGITGDTSKPAIYINNPSGPASIANSSITDNVGRGLLFTGGFSASLTITSSDISRNDGGVSTNVATSIGNSLIADNTAPAGSSGGGINQSAAVQLDILNTTISGNSVTGSIGGGVFLTGGNFFMDNSIVWFNTSGGSPNNFSLGAATVVTFSYNNVELTNLPATLSSQIGSNGNISLDPGFEDAASGNYRLGSNSPSIDAADADLASSFSTDLDGNNRFVDDTDVTDTGVGFVPYVDMGPYERQLPSGTLIVTTADGGLPAEDGFCSLREAIENANTDTTQGFSSVGECGAGNGVDFISFAGDFNINLTVGADAQNALPPIIEGLIIDGQANTITLTQTPGLRFFEVNTTDPVAIRNLTLDGGQAVNGGAISVFDGDFSSENNIYSNNTAADAGGAIWVGQFPSGVRSINDTFINNAAADSNTDTIADGGAIASTFSVPIFITNGDFDSNSADVDGGAISVFGDLTINFSRFVNNSADFDSDAIGNGGAVEFSGGILSISESSFDSNRSNSAAGGAVYTAAEAFINASTFVNNTANALHGGALHVSGTEDIEVLNSTFTGNNANAGGAIWDEGEGRLILDFNTITGNSDSSGGGGIYRAAGLGQVQLKANIVAFNTPASCFNAGGGFVVDAFNYTDDGDPSCPTIDPQFNTSAQLDLGTLADNGGTTRTIAIGANSEAIDAVSAGNCTSQSGSPITIDQRGVVRPFDGDFDFTAECDAGAYEAEPTSTDLSLDVTASLVDDLDSTTDLDAPAAAANEGDQVDITVELYNFGNDTSGVQVQVTVDAGLTLDSFSATQGTYDTGTGIWDVGTMTNTQLETLNLALIVDTGTFGSTLTVSAEVIASAGVDTDPDDNKDSDIVSVVTCGGSTNFTLSDGDTFGLIQAILCLNAAGGGSINLATGGTYTFTSAYEDFIGPTALPLIVEPITINGNGSAIVYDPSTEEGRLFALSTADANGDLTLNDITLRGGLLSSDAGGLIYNEFGNLTINNGNLDDGSAVLGGAIYNSGDMSIDGTTFDGNTANGGGAIYSDGFTTLAMSNSTLSNNTASGSGGGIQASDTDLTLTNTDFIGNTANGSGGGLFWSRSDGGSLSITGGSFLNNTSTAGTGGAALLIQPNDPAFAIDGTSFQGNIADGDGGAIHLQDGGDLSLLNLRFVANESINGNGGALHINNHFFGSVQNSLFSGNKAFNNGGGIHIELAPGTSILRSSLTNNTALGNGGGLYVVGESTVQNVTLSGNNASSGGGLFHESSGNGDLELNFVTIANNIGHGLTTIAQDGSVTNVRNTLAAANSPSDCAISGGTISVASVNIDSDGSCDDGLGNAFTQFSLPQINIDALANNGTSTLTHALLPGSVAIDAVAGGQCNDAITGNPLTNDQRGSSGPRPIDGNGDSTTTCDVGAYEAPAPAAGSLDLEILKTASNTSVAPGTIGETYTITVNNLTASITATNVVVRDLLPAGVSYQGDDSSGSYNPANGIWQVGAIAGGGSAILNISFDVDADTEGRIIRNTANIINLDQTDLDTTNNSADFDLNVTSGAAIIVTTTSTGAFADGECSLSEAIQAANTDAPVEACPAGTPGTDVIVLESGAAYTYFSTSGLATDAETAINDVTSPIIINGNGATIERETVSSPPFRFLDVRATGDLTLNDLTFFGGDVPSGDGGAIRNVGTLTANRVIFNDNYAGGAGGAIQNEGQLTLNNSAFKDNFAIFGGGAVALLNGGQAVVNQSLFARNDTAGLGGAWHTDSSSQARMVNVTFSANLASQGGALFNAGSTTLAFATLTRNDSTNTGTGTSNGMAISNSGAFTLRNSIISRHTQAISGSPGTVCDGTLTLTGDNFYDDTTCGGSPSTQAAIALLPLGDNGGLTETHALATTSIAVDAVITCTDTLANAVDQDQRGLGRPVDGGSGSPVCDAGAYEGDFDATDVGVTLASNATNPNEEDVILITVTLVNNGPEDATSIVTSLNYPSALTLEQVAGDGSYNSNNDSWTVDTLTVGSTATLDIVLRVADGEAGNNLSVSATIDGLAQRDTVAANNSDSITFNVQASNFLVDVYIENPGIVRLGEPFALTTVVVNRGPNDAQNVQVQLDLPAEMRIGMIDTSNGSYNADSGGWQIDYLLAQSRAMLTLTGVIDTETGLRTLEAQVTLLGAAQGDPDETDNLSTLILAVQEPRPTATPLPPTMTPTQRVVPTSPAGRGQPLVTATFTATPEGDVGGDEAPTPVPTSTDTAVPPTMTPTDVPPTNAPATITPTVPPTPIESRGRPDAGAQDEDDFASVTLAIDE